MISQKIDEKVEKIFDETVEKIRMQVLSRILAQAETVKAALRAKGVDSQKVMDLLMLKRQQVEKKIESAIEDAFRFLKNVEGQLKEVEKRVSKKRSAAAQAKKALVKKMAPKKSTRGKGAQKKASRKK